MDSPGLLLLHPDDNVYVCRTHVARGDLLLMDGDRVLAVDDIETGHKIARRCLGLGQKVLKYGAPIGSMTAVAQRGTHIHLHNMASDYIPSHTRLAGRRS